MYQVRQTFPNSDVPETRVQIILSKKDILELPKDSEHIYKKKHV